MRFMCTEALAGAVRDLCPGSGENNSERVGSHGNAGLLVSCELKPQMYVLYVQLESIGGDGLD